MMVAIVTERAHVMLTHAVTPFTSVDHQILAKKNCPSQCVGSRLDFFCESHF